MRRTAHLRKCLRVRAKKTMCIYIIVIVQPSYMLPIAGSVMNGAISLRKGAHEYRFWPRLCHQVRTLLPGPDFVTGAGAVRHHVTRNRGRKQSCGKLRQVGPKSSILRNRGAPTRRALREERPSRTMVTLTSLLLLLCCTFVLRLLPTPGTSCIVKLPLPHDDTT